MGRVIAAFIIGGLAGYHAGWVNAHHTVKTECERLGAFYVGNKTFHCTEAATGKGSPRIEDSGRSIKVNEVNLMGE